MPATTRKKNTSLPVQGEEETDGADGEDGEDREDGAVAKKGSQCSVKGKAYELQIARACRQFQSPHMNIAFLTQTDDKLGGCGADIDILLNWKNESDIGVEAKRPTPDWMQMKLRREEGGHWIGVENNKIPKRSKELFDSILQSFVLFGGKIPAFCERKLTYVEWKSLKQANPEFKDHYLVCPPDTIANLYREKHCQYLQVLGKGLYHTGEDVCGFGVPFFRCEQRIRIRCKVHTEKDSRGFASLSVTAAAQPAKSKMADLPKSAYSLDSVPSMPPQLVRIVSKQT